MKVRGLRWPFLLLLWMLCSSRKASWISLSPFLGSWGSDFPTQSNKNSFVLDLNHSSPLIFRSAFAVWCNRGKTYWLLQSKAGCFESPGSKIQCFWTSTTCSLPKTPPNPMHHERWYDHLWHEKWVVVTRGYSDNSKLPTWHDSLFECLSGMLPCIKNVVLVSVLLLDAGRGLCQGEICSHGEASTVCSLSEHDGKCTSLFNIFTECKSVKPLMVCHLDGNCSPFRGRQVKHRACVFWVLMWKIFSLLGDYCHIYMQ